MRVLLHSPSPVEAPIGVWWYDADTDYVKSYYAEDRPEKTVGQVDVLSKLDNGTAWEDYFTYLAAQAPYVTDYLVADIPDDASPAQLLADVREAAVRAERGRARG